MLITPQIVVAIDKPAQGGEVVSHAFTLETSFVCLGCGFNRAHTLAPVEVFEADGTATTTGAALCKACCSMFPLLPPYCRETWPAITARDIETLWDMARKKQITQAIELGRPDATATRGDGSEGVTAAAQQASGNQESNGACEVVHA